MAFSPETEIAPRVALMAPSCPQPVIMRAVEDAAIEFCTRTWIYREILDPVPITADVQEYEIDAPSNKSEIIGLLSVTKDGTPFKEYVYIKPTMRMNDIPTVDFDLTVEAALRPARGIVDYPDILEDYVEEIAQGALYRVLRVPMESWYNPAEASVCYNRFRSGCNQVKYMLNKNASANNLIVRKRDW